jgi:O-acetyl-ADP-ribose deacetylase (regulator of RNase III)
MIEYKKSDLFSEDVEALVNAVNCVGIMGRGIALQFKQAWPNNFIAYAAACRRNTVRPGSMFIFETGSHANPRYIINFPTKRHWRDPSRIEDIDAGLAALVGEIQKRNIRSIAMPAIGAGLGGLSWAVVRGLIEKIMAPLQDMAIVVFEPHEAGDSSKKVSNSRRVNLQSAGQ